MRILVVDGTTEGQRKLAGRIEALDRSDLETLDIGQPEQPGQLPAQRK